MTNQLGYLSAFGLVIVGVAYVIAVAIGIVDAGSSEPIRDPVLAVMEIITLISAPLIVVVFAAVHEHASSGRRVYAVIALCFATLMAGVTSAVHFIALTWGRQTGFQTLEWPSPLYAAELLAWDLLLGLALLFGACVFPGPGREARVKWSAAIAGILCIAGGIGPAVGRMAIQRIGIVGYGLGLPITAYFLANLFRWKLETSKCVVI